MSAIAEAPVTAPRRERRVIVENMRLALLAARGRQRPAAEVLGISHRTIGNRLRRWAECRALAAELARDNAKETNV